jgi:hypothetical protein
MEVRMCSLTLAWIGMIFTAEEQKMSHRMSTLAIIVIALFGTEQIMATEEPGFELIAKMKDYEIRAYGPIIVAETVVSSEFDQAGNDGFRVLADYIFGNNTSKSKIAMTAPVSQSASEKIAMTAPVNLAGAPGNYTVQFTMPASYSMDSLPLPNDKRVTIRLIPARRVAVYRYSDNWSNKVFEEKKLIFLELLRQDGVSTSGPAEFARFDPPFMPWFLKRNEIWMTVNP